MKLRAQVAHVAQIGELTELRLVAIGNHVAEFHAGQEVEVTVTAVPAGGGMGLDCTCPFPRYKCPRCAHPCGACEAASLSDARPNRPVPSPPPKEPPR